MISRMIFSSVLFSYIMNLCIHFCSGCKLLFTVWHSSTRLTCPSFFTCYIVNLCNLMLTFFTVLYCLVLYLRMHDHWHENLLSLSCTLLCELAYSQQVSYFSLLHMYITVLTWDMRWITWKLFSIFSISYFVNLHIHWCSDVKLFFTALKCLTI